MDDSTSPALEDLAFIIDFLPSLENPNLAFCRGAKKVRDAKQNREKCGVWIGEPKQQRAKPLWVDLVSREYFPDNEDFYYKLETLLGCIHCHKHVGDAFTRYRSWRAQRSLDAVSPLSESSVPGTPEQRSSTEFPSETEITPFSSPFTMDETPGTPNKWPDSDAADSFIQSTPTRSTRTRVSFSQEAQALDTAEMISERISTMTITTSPDKSTCDTSETIVENFSAMAISSRNTPQESESLATAETSAEHISTTTIAVKEETNMTNVGGKDTTKDVRVVGLGLITTLQRKGSLRDDSPVIRELHKHLTPQQLEEGVLYILEHTGTPGLFKIGWTRTSVHERLGQPGNCYGKDTKVLHETSSGRFAGASKAERLVQVILRHQNIQVVECEQCGGGHKEWFKSSKDEVLRTVKLMEDFVQMPAYEMCQGEMKLSRDANAFIKVMCNFSTARLESLMGGGDNGVRETTESTWSAGTQVTAAQVTVEPSGQESQGDEENSSSSTAHFPGKAKPPRRSLGTKTGTAVKSVKGFAGKTKDRVGKLFSRSRESTPEPGDAGSTDRPNGNANKPNGTEELLVKFLWSLLPDDSKPEKGVTGDDGPRDMAALRTVVRQMTDDFWVDYHAAYENDGDGQEPGVKETKVRQ
ncbi:hypothetical protein ACHAPT_011348 [Fusarium lateritium]